MNPSLYISPAPVSSHDELAAAIQKFIEAVTGFKKEMEEEEQKNAESSRNGIRVMNMNGEEEHIQPGLPVQLRMLRYRARMLDDT